MGTSKCPLLTPATDQILVTVHWNILIWKEIEQNISLSKKLYSSLNDCSGTIYLINETDSSQSCNYIFSSMYQLFKKDFIYLCVEVCLHIELEESRWKHGYPRVIDRQMYTKNYLTSITIREMYIKSTCWSVLPWSDWL